jgi:hypothetical protein
MADKNLEFMQQELAKMERDLVFYNLELKTKWNSHRRGLLLEQIRKMTEAKLNMIRRINDLLIRQTQNMERFLEEIKEKEKKDKA